MSNVELEALTSGHVTQRSNMTSSAVRNANQRVNAKARADKDCRPVHLTGAPLEICTKFVGTVTFQVVPRAVERERPCGSAIRDGHMHCHCVKFAKQRRCVASYPQTSVYCRMRSRLCEQQLVSRTMQGRLCARTSWPHRSQHWTKSQTPFQRGHVVVTSKHAS